MREAQPCLMPMPPKAFLYSLCSTGRAALPNVTKDIVTASSISGKKISDDFSLHRPKTEPLVSMDSLYLIDAHAYLHRAYHAIPPLTNSRGEQVNAIFGFLR